MAATFARHVVCFLHDNLDALDKIVAEFPGFALDREYSQASPDDRMRQAFEASMDLVEPSFEDSDWSAIEGHRAVAYVLSPPIVPEEAREISSQALRLVSAAFAGGARAAKGESAGIAHGSARWRTLAVELDMPGRRDFALHGAWVRRPIGDDDTIYTCGMHLLGLPDVEIGNDLEPYEAVRWLDVFALYSLVEVEPDALEDGHTFRPHASESARPITHRPCERYDVDDFFFNPHGYWRLGDPIGVSTARAKRAATMKAAKKPTKKLTTKPTKKRAAAPKPKAKAAAKRAPTRSTRQAKRTSATPAKAAPARKSTAKSRPRASTAAKRR